MAIAIAPQYTQRHYQWTQFKQIHAVKNLLIQYDESPTEYTIYGYDGPEVHMCTIWKCTLPDSINQSQEQNDADMADFEANYKDESNRPIALRVELAPTGSPTGKTPVRTVALSNTSGSSGTYTEYVVPSGKQLYITKLSAGCAGENGKGAKVELYWDPNGNGTGQELIEVLYCNASSLESNFNYIVPLVGNGTRRIRLRRITTGGGSQEVYAAWEGFY